VITYGTSQHRYQFILTGTDHPDAQQQSQPVTAPHKLLQSQKYEPEPGMGTRSFAIMYALVG